MVENIYVPLLLVGLVEQVSVTEVKVSGMVNTSWRMTFSGFYKDFSIKVHLVVQEWCPYRHALRLTADREINGRSNGLSTIIFVTGYFQFSEGIGFNAVIAALKNKKKFHGHRHIVRSRSYGGSTVGMAKTNLIISF